LAVEQQNVMPTGLSCFAAEKTDVAVWKELLGQAQQCEQLSKGRKSMRKLMLQLYGGHSAYHDAKAHTRLTHAHKVCCHLGSDMISSHCATCLLSASSAAFLHTMMTS